MGARVRRRPRWERVLSVQTSRTIAGLYGPMLVVMTVTEMLNPRTWDNTIAPVTDLS